MINCLFSELVGYEERIAGLFGELDCVREEFQAHLNVIQSLKLEQSRVRTTTYFQTIPY